MAGPSAPASQWLYEIYAHQVVLRVDAGELQWKYDTQDDTAWQTLMVLDPFIGPAGEDGREVEFQVSATHIQWRYVGDVAWTDLVALATLQGPAGPAGVDGTDGVDGAPGAPGAPGVVQSIVAGTNVTVDSTDPANPIVSATGGGAALEVQEEGVAVDSAVETINFTGAGVTATQTAAGVVQVDIPGGGGGGGSQVGIATALASGDYYLNQESAGTWTNAVVTGGLTQSVITLLILDSELTVDAIAVRVTSPTAGESVDVGVYEFLGCGKPGQCLMSGNISLASAVTAEAVLGAPVTLQPGVYFILLHSVNSVTATIASANGSSGGDRSISLLHSGLARFSTGPGTTDLLITNANLPGGTYSLGMDLTGLVLTTANTGSSSTTKRVFFKKA